MNTATPLMQGQGADATTVDFSGSNLAVCGVCGATYPPAEGHACRYFYDYRSSGNIPRRIPQPLPLALGWECPRCHRCYAPSVLQCGVCAEAGNGDRGREP